MKTRLIFCTLAAGLLFYSCATTMKTGESTNFTPSVIQKPVVADLQVSEVRVSGTATGKSSKGVGAIKELAVADALSQSKADVLVEPRYEITKTFSRITVNVTGYPATYKNFRPMEAGDTMFIKVSEKSGLGFKRDIDGGDNLGSNGKVLIASGSGLLLAAGAFFAALLFF